MKFTRRSFGKLAGIGILAASMPESVWSDTEGEAPEYSYIPLTDVVDHLNPSFSDHTPRSIASKPSTQQE